MNAYRVWISEIMLQQTRVEAVKPYYERFLKELPDVKALAEVPEDRLLKLWEGLGYYNRARNLKEAAGQIVRDYGGKFPETYEEIRRLKESAVTLRERLHLLCITFRNRPWTEMYCVWLQGLQRAAMTLPGRRQRRKLRSWWRK